MFLNGRYHFSFVFPESDTMPFQSKRSLSNLMMILQLQLPNKSILSSLWNWLQPASFLSSFNAFFQNSVSTHYLPWSNSRHLTLLNLVPDFIFSSLFQPNWDDKCTSFIIPLPRSIFSCEAWRLLTTPIGFFSKNPILGVPSDSVSWTSDPWFLLRSWSQGCGIESHVRLSVKPA